MNINYKQLAFILDIEPREALEKIISVYCKVFEVALPPKCDTVTQYKKNNCPVECDVEILAKNLNLPDLPMAVVDIRENYLTRPASKKWILFDYPENQIRLLPRDKVKFPPVLESLMKAEDVAFVKGEWNKRFGIPVK